MYLAKFSQVISIELEICSIEENKLRSLLNQPNIFSSYEKKYCQKKPTPLLSAAGLWCVKQAFTKAATTRLGFFDFNCLDVEVRHHDSGQPKIVLQGSLKQKFREEDINVEVAISHTKTLAAASVLFWHSDRENTTFEILNNCAT